jgi:hypothetical protein
VCVITCEELAIGVRYEEDVDHVYSTGFSIGRRRVKFCVQSFEPCHVIIGED